ncbi:MAG: ABC transporter permease [Acetobacteraceae bacterium]
MMPLPLSVALAHLRSRKRQTFVSIMGVTLGVGVFVSISGMMQGFQTYFRTQIIESNPHIVMTDEIRRPARQPLQLLYPEAAVDIRRIQPRDPVRGITGAAGILESLATIPGVSAAPTLRGQMILRRAGRDYAVTALGIDPAKEGRVTSLARDMVEGRIEALGARPDGVVIGASLARKMGAAVGDTLVAATVAGGETALRIVGLFRTGLEQQDNGVVYVSLSKQQSMQARPRVINEIRIRLDDISRTIPTAAMIEGRFGFKTAPWEETFSRVLSVFVLQNAIIFVCTASILLVAGFGIFNIISTVVMEKARDIAIMRSIGVAARTIVTIFVIEGAVVGLAGTVAGWGLGLGFSAVLERVPAPGGENGATLIVRRSFTIYATASAIALAASLGAAWLPARRSARTDPLTVIRGAA